MEGGLAGRTIRVCSGQRQAESTKTASRQWTGESDCENRHVGNQADSWATHWQEAPWPLRRVTPGHEIDFYWSAVGEPGEVFLSFFQRRGLSVEQFSRNQELEQRRRRFPVRSVNWFSFGGVGNQGSNAAPPSKAA